MYSFRDRIYEQEFKCMHYGEEESPLVEWRKEVAMMSQKELGTRIGYCAGHLSRVEHGKLNAGEKLRTAIVKLAADRGLPAPDGWD